MLENSDVLAQNISAEQSEQPAARIEENVMLHFVTEGVTDEHLKEVYSDPYITKVGHDHRQAAPIIHPNVTYLSAWVSGQFAGAFMAIKFSPVEYEIHSLLKNKYVLSSRILVGDLIDWVFSHESVMRVTAYIIEGLEKSKNLCLKLGFKQEGFRRNACIQGGNVKGVYVLGILREEWCS